jgi:hypothetical protein
MLKTRTTHVPHRTVARTLVTLGAMLTIAVAAEAGPPLICHPFDAGSAQLLPWTSQGQNWNTPDRSYDVQKLTADVLRLLTPDAPIIARMENMRRATIYAGQDRRVAADLLNAVVERATADTAKASRDSLALFDAGYLLESYMQASHIDQWQHLSETAATATKAVSLTAADGYGLVRKAIEVTGNSPEMEFAASLMKNGPIAAEHRRKAQGGAKAGSLLARNLEK